MTILATNASSGIRIHDQLFERSKTLSAFESAVTVISYLQLYESMTELISVRASCHVLVVRPDFKQVPEVNNDWHGNAFENTRR
jgi:hypothetical protein